MNKTAIAILLDSSSSISDYKLTDGVVEYYNTAGRTFKETSLGQEVFIDTWHFNERVAIRSTTSAASWEPRMAGSYRPYGMTAMYDAVVAALDNFKVTNRTGMLGSNASFLVLCITDGENTAGRIRNAVEMMTYVRAFENYFPGKLTLTFAVPNMEYKKKLVGIGIAEGNIEVWDTTQKGIQVQAQQVQVAATQFMAARAAGTSSVKDFYKVSAAKVTGSKLARKADDVSLVTKVLDVGGIKEDKSTWLSVKSFVESHGLKFVIGAVFYELTKKELVQAHKGVMLFDKDHPEVIFGGAGVRDLVSMPDENVKVAPGDMGKYRLFVQSTSVNRKLQPGTKVLYRTDVTEDLKPTWNHLAVPAAV